jgi:hypothetical protein
MCLLTGNDATMIGGNALIQNQFRLEPHLADADNTTDTTAPSAATISRLDARSGRAGYSMYSETEKKKRPFRRTALLATLTGIFSFGTALGLFASAWLKNNPHYAEAAKAAITGRETPVLVVVAKERGDDMERHEEKPPDTKSVDKPAQEPAPSSVKPPIPPIPSVKPDEEESVPVPAESDQTAVAKTRRPEPAKQVEPSEPEQKASEPKMGESTASEPKINEPNEPKASEPAASNVPPPNAPPPQVVSVPPPPVAAKVPPVPEKKQRQVARAPRKSHTVRNAEPSESGEIDRIKRQAGDELRSKTAWRNGDRAGRSRQNGLARTSSSYVSKRNLVIQCAQIPSIIDRERCKWKWCNGLWGKNGCPSYDPPRSSF